MKITRVHHVQITIPQGAEEEGRRFYCGLLGLQELSKPPALAGRGGFWLRVGDVGVHVGTEERPAGSSTKAHLAYEVHDLKGWRRRLTRPGLRSLTRPPCPAVIDLNSAIRSEIESSF